MNCLLIDIGNTCLKWGLDEEGMFTFGGRHNYASGLDETLFENLPDDTVPEAAFISCVGHDEVKRQLCELLQARWGLAPSLLQSVARECGVSNAYPQPATLGSDRWAAMIAAFAQIKGPVCVIDCGTAVTLDVVNQAGVHLGGLIVPGYGLMQTCLQQGTHMTFRHEPAEAQAWQLGRTSEQCIQQGAGQAISGMVSKTIDRLQAENSGLELLLTGGDAELLQNQLDCIATIEEHLVLKGLGIIYRARTTADSL